MSSSFIGFVNGQTSYVRIWTKILEAQAILTVENHGLMVLLIVSCDLLDLFSNVFDKSGFKQQVFSKQNLTILFSITQ